MLLVWLVAGCDDGEKAAPPDAMVDRPDMAVVADGRVGPTDGEIDPDEGVEADEGVDPDAAVDGAIPDAAPDGPPPVPPEATRVDEIRIDADETSAFELTGTGGEGALTVIIGTWPANGSLSRDGVMLAPVDLPLAAPVEVVYTPNEGAFGDDGLSFTVTDELGLDSEPVEVEIVVNGLPIAVDDVAETDEEVPVDIAVLDNDRDPEEGPLSILGVVQPENGAVQPGFGGTVTYQPAEAFVGVDTFEYTVRDRDGAEGRATVTVTVAGRNDVPVAVDPGAVFTDEDEAVEIELGGDDEEDPIDALTIRVITEPEGGALDVVEGAAPLVVTYTPAQDFNGADGLTFVVVDTDGAESEPFEVFVNVQPVNDAPVAVDDVAQTPEEVSARINVTANDTDIDDEPDDLIVFEVGEAANGTVEIGPANLQSVTYHPNDGFAGEDTFTYRVRDRDGADDTATVTVTVAGENDAPVGVPVADQEVEEDGALDLRLTGVDEEEPIENLTVRIIAPPERGRFDVDEHSAPWDATYRPNPDFFGEDAFTFVIEDGAEARSEPVVVNIRVTSVNDPPNARDDFARTDTLTPVVIDIQANDTDVDDRILRVIEVTEPPSGAVASRGDGRLVYTPVHPNAGEMRFEYTLEDGAGERSTAEVVVDVALADVVSVESFAADPPEITEGRSSTLSWETAFADTCEILPGVGEVFAQAGQMEVSPEVSTNYTITCDGPGDPVVSLARITVLPDGDRDGIPTQREIELGYLPGDPDSDDDGLLDGVEDRDQDGQIDEGETGVLDSDTDDDGLPDGFEDANANGILDEGETDPTDPDSDDDGLCDFVREDNDGDGVIDPEDPCDPPVAAVAIERFDADPLIPLRGEPSTLSWRTIAAVGCIIEPGVGEIEPLAQGSVEVTPEEATTYTLTCTGPGPDVVAEVRITPDSDADNDGIPNRREEELGYRSDLADTDGDGLEDGVEDPNHDGPSPGETSATDDDSDDDGLLDGIEDANGDRVVQPTETDPLDPDTDVDGIADGVEDANHDGVLDEGETNPLDRDSDDDSLVDGIEDANQDGVVDDGETDPRDPDSDDDGRCDATRVDNEADGFDVADDCVGSEVYEGIWFVDANHVGASNGVFWDAAFTHPADALALAEPGDQVWVAAGRYRPRAPNEPVLAMVSDVEVYGGFAGDELTLEARQDPLLPAVLDGDVAGDGRDATDALHVVIGASRARLDGFIVTGGNDAGAGGDGGGGLLARNADGLSVVRTTLRENLAHFGGGANVLGGRVVFEDVFFDGNTATGSGGGLFVDDGAEVTLTRTRFEGNRSTGTGGGATFEARSVVTGETVRFFENAAVGSGGGLALEAAATAEFADARFEENTSGTSGGAASAEADATMELDGALLFGNTAAVSGGGLTAEDNSDLVLREATLVGNVAAEAGGAIAAEDQGSATLTNVLVIGNRADRGGALFAADSAFTAEGTALRDNVALLEGGGVYAEDFAGVSLERVHVASNRAQTGGGLFVLEATLTGVDVVVTGNVALDEDGEGEGGGLAIEEEAVVTLTNATLSRNTSTIGGGVSVLESELLTLNNVTLVDNVADVGGGLFTDEESEVRLYNVVAYGNAPEAVAVIDEEEFGLEIAGGCADQDLDAFEAEGVVFVEADPLVRAASGEAFLAQDGPCIDAGDAALVQEAFEALNIDWATRTTDRAGVVLDAAPLDGGHHHDPATTWISVLEAPTEGTIAYEIHGEVDCILVDDAGGDAREIAAGAGELEHEQPEGTVFTLMCRAVAAKVEVPPPIAIP